MMLPQINLDLQRLSKWVDKKKGVTNPHELSRLLKNFDGIYDHRMAHPGSSDYPKYAVESRYM
jgi:hypothetical protein